MSMLTKEELTMLALVNAHDKSDAVTKLCVQEKLTPDSEIKVMISALLDKLKQIPDEQFLRLPVMDYFGE